MPRLAALAVALALPALMAGCFGYEPGWRIVDRDRNCSECDDVVFRDGDLEASWSGRIGSGHDLWGSYAHPEPDSGRITLAWTVSTPVQPARIEFAVRTFGCGFEGGNATTDQGSLGGADWSITVRPGQGRCEADLAWGAGWKDSFISWFLPDGTGGAYAPIDVEFTAHRSAQDS